MSLGACLAGNGHKTLIVDLDSQSNLTMSAGIDPDSLELALPDLLDPENEDKPDPASVLQDTVIDQLTILPGDLRLAAIERSLYNTSDYENILANLLKSRYDQYTYILIDCPPSLGALTLIALTAADTVLVPVQCEYYAARGLVQLLNVINAVREHTNADLGYRLVITLFDKRNKITRLVYDQLQENFADYFYDTIIGIDTKLRECAVVGEPITQYAPRSRGSLNYQRLAKEISNSYQPKGV